MAISLKSARVNAELSRPAVIKRLKDEYGIKLSVNTLANYENKGGSHPDCHIRVCKGFCFAVCICLTLH